MKILQVDVNYGRSSTGKIVEALHREYAQLGHSSWVRYGRGPQVNAPGVRRIAHPAEVHAHAGLTRATGLTGAWSPAATRALIRDIGELRPDVVHLHELHGYYVNYLDVVAALKGLRVPVVWSFHCEFMYTGKCGYAHDCERWTANCGHCPQKRVYPASLTFDLTGLMLDQKRRVFEGMDRLVICCPSEWLADRVRRSFLRDQRIMRIFNGIDTTVFQPRRDVAVRHRYGLEDAKVLLAVAGNLLDPIKGGDWMLKLADRLRGEAVKLVLVGMPETFNSDNIVAIPSVRDQNELSELYSVADLLVLPSRRETFSLVCAEALACGTPVVGFESGAPAEVAPPGYGVFVPYGDLDRLERSIRSELFEAASLAPPDECRRFALARYSDQVMASAYLDAYSIALGLA